MTTLALKRRIGRYWPASPSEKKIILLYHSIGNHDWGLQKEKFYDQMNWLTDHCRVLSLTELIRAVPTQETQVAITFDDGYHSIYEHAADFLYAKKIKPMVYLTTGWMKENQRDRKQSVAELGHYPNEYFLVWPEVKELCQLNWEIGSHGVNHYNFTMTSKEVTQYEIAQSKKLIEININANCLHFSYPWGKHSLTLKRMVKAAGYRYAVAARHNEMTIYSDYFTLPRMNIEKDYSFEDFKNIINGKWNYLGLIHRLKGL